MIGIDVSTHQGVIDWEKVKGAGIEFAMIRAGYGQNNIDKKFIHNISECNRLGIPCGAYWFSYALNEEMARYEAKYCLDAVKPYKLEFPIAFDLEYDSIDYMKKKNVVATKFVASSFAKAFCSEIEKAGYYALNYCNQDYANRYFEDEVKQKYGKWLAAWTGKAQPPMECQIWQYSNCGTVAGINGRVDLDRSYVNFPQIIKERGLNGLKNEVEQNKNVEINAKINAEIIELAQKETWYTNALAWGVENGITDGINPESGATKAQIITMLKRYHEKFEK